MVKRLFVESTLWASDIALTVVGFSDICEIHVVACLSQVAGNLVLLDVRTFRQMIPT